ncbi:MAG: indolepyruvate oxidoreductase, subunit beta [Bacteroidota bacterium]|jgi:Pyruvate/2-oxoacid:ferredoxin oxidoreductase gamma subunit
MKQVYTLIIAGIGGQGINGFMRRLHHEIGQQGHHLIASRYKGGAQRLGSVHAECKLILSEAPELQQQSSQIIPGTLDLLIGLESWETLRFIPFCNSETLIISDTFTEYPPGTKQQAPFASPEPFFEALQNPLLRQDFKAIATQQGLAANALPILLMNRAIERLHIPINPLNLLL